MHDQAQRPVMRQQTPPTLLEYPESEDENVKEESKYTDRPNDILDSP